MIDGDVDARIQLLELPENGATVISLRDSYLNYASSDELKPLLKEIVGGRLDAGNRRFIVNLARVGVMDSCGLAVLISLKKLIEARGGLISLTNLSVMIQRLFQLTKLDQAFEIHATEEQAIAAI